MTTINEPTTQKNPDLQLLALLLLLVAGMVGVTVVGLIALLLMNSVPVADYVGTLLGITDKTPWYFSRSAGTVAYLLLAASTIWGLLLTTKIVKEAIPAALSLAMHNILSWLALAFTGLHGAALLFDNYYNYSLADLGIPFIGPYRPGWVGLGIVAFYLMALITLSFQVRKQLGQKLWRALHYLTFGVFILATVHSITAGTDSGKPSMQLVYLGSGLLVLFLTNYRVLTAGQTNTAPAVASRHHRGRRVHRRG